MRAPHDAGAAPAPWSALGEKNIAEKVRLADEGNTDAGRRLLHLAARCLRDKQPFPETLRAWLAVQLEAVSKEPARAGEILRVTPARGRRREHSTDMHDRLEYEAFQNMVAWAVFHAVRAKEGPTAPNSRGDPTVFEIVSRWATQRGRRCSIREARRWYEERLPRMRAEHARFEEI